MVYCRKPSMENSRLMPVPSSNARWPEAKGDRAWIVNCTRTHRVLHRTSTHNTATPAVGNSPCSACQARSQGQWSTCVDMVRRQRATRKGSTRCHQARSALLIAWRTGCRVDPTATAENRTLQVPITVSFASHSQPPEAQSYAPIAEAGAHAESTTTIAHMYVHSACRGSSREQPAWRQTGGDGTTSTRPCVHPDTILVNWWMLDVNDARVGEHARLNNTLSRRHADKR